MFSGIDIVFEGNMLVLEGDAFGGRVLTARKSQIQSHSTVLSLLTRLLCGIKYYL